MKLVTLLIFAALFFPRLAPASDPILMDDRPATEWQRHVYPIGNGRIGATLYGGVDEARLQFTVDSLWTGNENLTGAYNAVPKQPGGDHFGSYQNMGELVFTAKPGGEVKNYRRTLDLGRALHGTRFERDGVTITRSAIASYPAMVVAWRLEASKPGSVSGALTLQGAHPGSEKITAGKGWLRLGGELINGLDYAAEARVVAEGGKVTAVDGALVLEDCDAATVLLSADTNYVMDRAKGWMEGKAAERVTPRLEAAVKKGWKGLLDEHVADHRSLFDRVEIDLGTTPDEVLGRPLRERIENYRSNARDLPRKCLDPDLEELLFQYGRYLLIGCSRPGSLPANLQGVWNHQNKPAWFADYHTNINLQMNYWLAESANLPELVVPMFDMLDAGVPVYAEATRREYGDVEGYVTRMSLNPYGGGGWNWNIEGTAWLAQHYWTHYLYGGDRGFLKQRGYPFLRDVSKFWLARLKELPDGRLVVPNAWSHEHGPHEDGTAHAQQLMWDLFTNTMEAAEVLGTDADFAARLKTTRDRLVGPKIGSWGQLMEWMEEKPDLEKGNHRHTSHLFAVHPGRQISMAETPELAEAARVSLEKRGEVGDSRRSWTWAWRTALWARLGQPERAHGCVAGLLAYNMHDNLWATHPPFQIDGNLGITAGIAEMLLQSQAGEIALLPALTGQWATGSVRGLRAQGGHVVDIEWENGQLTKATIRKGWGERLPVSVAGERVREDDARVVWR